VSIRLSLYPIYRPLQQHAAGLLLGVPRAGDVDRLLHNAPVAGGCAAGAGRSAATTSQQQMRTVSRLQPP